MDMDQLVNRCCTRLHDACSPSTRTFGTGPRARPACSMHMSACSRPSGSLRSGRCLRLCAEPDAHPHCASRGNLRHAGLNVYLISRTESKLAAAAEEVQSNYNVETKYFVADLAAAGDPGDAGACWFGLRSNLEGLDVGVLVNNAGMSYEHPDFLHSLEEPMLSALLAINAASLTKMCHLVVPGMKERGRGCIVNISSGVSAALPACPLLSVYAATKAYVDTLSASLAAEYAHFGVKVQVRGQHLVRLVRHVRLVPQCRGTFAASVRLVVHQSSEGC